MNEKMQFLVDGENFRHQIAGVLLKHGKIGDKNAYFTFDFAGFCRDVLQTKQLEISYYTTKIKQPNQPIPAKLVRLITKISSANRKWVAQLTNQNIRVVKAGHLRVRETSACVHCGKKTLVLQEKGVDVRVAADLLIAATRPNAVLAVGSSDSDITPALEAVKRLVAQIGYVCYAGQLNRAVAAQVQKVVTFDDAIVLKHFGRAK